MNKKIFIALALLTTTTTQPMAINTQLALAQHQQSSTKTNKWAFRLIGLTFGVAGISDFIAARRRYTAPTFGGDDPISGFIYIKPLAEIMSGLGLLCMGQLQSNAQHKTDILVYHLEQQALKEKADNPEQFSATAPIQKPTTAATLLERLPSAGTAAAIARPLLRKWIPFL